MTTQDPAPQWHSLVSFLKARDFARAKAIAAELRAAGLSSVEQQALFEILDSGALDRLHLHRDEVKAEWLATQIITAAENTNRNAAHTLALELRTLLARSGSPLDEELAIKTLNALKEVRAFEALARLGDRLLALGLKDPKIAKLTAQGLIDFGSPHAGIGVLEPMLNSAPHDHPQRVDGLGLAGRAHKQIYVDACDQPATAKAAPLRSALLQSASRYEDAFVTACARQSPAYGEWSYHGINLVAVMARAAKDGITIPSRFQPKDLAKKIITGFEQLDPSNRGTWDYASIGEAYVALGDWPQAERWLVEYAHIKKVDAFQLAGTIRQLEEVWRLDTNQEHQGRILFVLKAQLLAKEGGHVLLTPEARAKLLAVQPQSDSGAQCEVFLSDGRPKPIAWFQRGLERCNSVGLIKRRSNDEGFATGFLVRGGDFIPHLGDEPVLLTNAHVISERPTELNDPHVAAVRPELAAVDFTEAGTDVPTRTFELDRILWDSPRSELDACLVALKAPPRDIPYCLLSDRKPKANESRVIVIGHPGGERQMKLSLYESPVTSVSNKGLLTTGSDSGHLFLRYNNPTIPGNSGSPVFDIDDWCVIGLHHAGTGAQAKDASEGVPGKPIGNEGVFIHSVSEAARRGERSLVPAGVPASATSMHAQSLPESAAATLESARSSGKAPATAKLAHDIPDRMKENLPLTITANISRMETEKLFAGLRRVDARVYDITPKAVMSAMLTAPDGGFEIVPLTYDRMEVNRGPAALDSVTTWKWSVKPLKPGHHRLVIRLDGHELRDGIQAALPASEESIAVRVQVDPSARALTVTKWAAVAASGGILSYFGQWVMRTML